MVPGIRAFPPGDEVASLDTKKPLKKNTLLYEAKKYVETYSSSNAAAQDPEERVFYNIVYTS